MKRMALTSLFILCVALVACQGGKKETPTASPTAAPAAGVSSGVPLARIGGETITDEDVRKVSGTKLAQAELELYDARKEGVDQIIESRLVEAEARRQGVGKDDLLKKNVYDKISISDKEIEKFYNEKKGQMQGKSLDEAKSNIRGYLFREKHQKVYGDLVNSLKKKADIAILIKAPKIEVEEGDSPAIGPKDAKVRVVEFTDYQCPFCGKSRPTVNQILQEYKGKVRYVLRDFPLSFHKDSMKAHEAAHCAGDQGKYWEMNKKLFGDQQEIKVDDLRKYAKELRLNADKFNQCLDSDKYADRIRKSQDYGSQIGVSGTPAFFINGRMISGARPFEAFKEVIDDELKSN